MDSAEQAALSQKMEGGTPKYFNSRRLAGPGEEGRGAGWQELELMLNRHFDHQPVNTSYSSVLLPQALSDAGWYLFRFQPNFTLLKLSNSSKVSFLINKCFLVCRRLEKRVNMPTKYLSIQGLMPSVDLKLKPFFNISHRFSRSLLNYCIKLLTILRLRDRSYNVFGAHEEKNFCKTA